MTQATATTQIQDGEAVDEAGADTAASHLAAIQYSYEDARACIVDPSRSPSYPAQDCVDAYPETEALEVDSVLPPVPHNPTPPTESMSVAARSLAEQMAVEDGSSQTTEGARAFLLPASAAPTSSRRWWRAIRATLRDAVPASRSDF